jgi:hypothetical protein
VTCRLPFGIGDAYVKTLVLVAQSAGTYSNSATARADNAVQQLATASVIVLP